MSATAAIEIGSDLWKARLYAGMSLASELAAGLNRPRLWLTGLIYQWKMYRQLGWMNRGVSEILGAAERMALQIQAGRPARTLTAEDYRAFRDDVLRWHAVQMRLLDPRDGFPRSGLLRKRLAQFEAQSERLLDLADWLDALSTPEKMDTRFDAALDDLARGAVVTWEAIQ
jgi:hypothetical protein